jgi:hypothetical protein
VFTSKGKLHYEDEEYRLVLKLDQDIADYYLRLIPATRRAYRQGWRAHITVVRPGIDEVGKIRYWGDYQNEEVEFIYSPNLEMGRGFYWFNAWSKRLEEIRSELGLYNVSKYPLIPDGYKKTFHCTVGRYDEKFASGDAPEK